MTIPLLAQSAISSIEIIGGPSLLSIRDDKQYKQYGEPKVGFSFGLGLVHKLNDRWSVNTQLGFERKGYKQIANAMYPPDIYNNPPTNSLPPLPTKLKGNLNNDYLTLSLLPRYFIGKKLKLYVGAGPYYGRLIKSQVNRTDIQNNQIKRRTILNQKESFYGQDFGISYSMGFILKEFTKTKVFGQINYNMGLINVQKLQPGIGPVKNNSLTVMIGLKFN